MLHPPQAVSQKALALAKRRYSTVSSKVSYCETNNLLLLQMKIADGINARVQLGIYRNGDIHAYESFHSESTRR